MSSFQDVDRIFRCSLLSLFDLKLGVESWKNAASVTFKYGVALSVGNVEGINVSLCIVKEETGSWVNSAHRANHLAPEQDILVLDYVGQEVDPWLMINAGVKKMLFIR